MEKLMQKTAKNRFSPNYKTESEALNRTYIYWQQNDHMERGDMAKIFEHLYLSPEHFKDTKIKICMDLNVNERTLLRYRKKFIKLFIFNLEQLKQEKNA